jgi:TATA-box binding protein (TBP) (component of TFIID and TFIIIB)
MQDDAYAALFGSVGGVEGAESTAADIFKVLSEMPVFGEAREDQPPTRQQDQLASLLGDMGIDVVKHGFSNGQPETQFVGRDDDGGGTQVDLERDDIPDATDPTHLSDDDNDDEQEDEERKEVDDKGKEEEQDDGPTVPPEDMPEITVSNVVCRGRVNCQLDLQHLSKKLKNSSLNRDSFPALFVRVRGVTLLIFSTGMVLATGGKTFEESNNAYRRLVLTLKKFQYPAALHPLGIENIIAKLHMGFPISVNRLLEDPFHRRYCTVQGRKFTCVNYYIKVRGGALRGDALPLNPAPFILLSTFPSGPTTFMTYDFYFALHFPFGTYAFCFALHFPFDLRFLCCAFRRFLILSSQVIQPQITVRIFPNGAVVFQSAKSMDTLRRAVSLMVPVFHQYRTPQYEPIDPASVVKFFDPVPQFSTRGALEEN